MYWCLLGSPHVMLACDAFFETAYSCCVQEQHQSWGARRAQQSFSRSLTNAKSDAVREAQERRAAAAAAKAKKSSKR